MTDPLTRGLVRLDYEPAAAERTQHYWSFLVAPALADRLAEAQRAYDNAKPGDCIQIDPDLLPYINRTEK